MSTDEELRKQIQSDMAKRILEKTRTDLSDIFNALMELRYFMEDSKYYDGETINKEKAIEKKTAVLLLYLDSMANLQKDLEKPE